MTTIRTCNATYLRDDRCWRYPWGAQVPGAQDLTIADVLAIGVDPLADVLPPGMRQLSDLERRWLRGEPLRGQEAVRLLRAGRRSDAGDLIVGMSAPELHPGLLLSIDDLARRLCVSRATIDSYRARGRVVQPQVVHGRTPLWTRPIVERWVTRRRDGGRASARASAPPAVAGG